MPQHTDSLYTLARIPTDIADDAVSGLLSPNYEMMTTLAWVAGFTSRVKLGSAVAVLPIRNAMANARQLATLDIYSGGRVVYGAGVGWLQEEAEAMAMPWDNRGRRSEEHIALLRALWTAEGDLVEFHGTYFDVPPIDPEPRPVQRPIPILIGGHSDVALDRAGRIGDGWMAASMSPERLATHWTAVRGPRNAADETRTSCSCTPESLAASRRPLNELVEEYAALGVDHLHLTAFRDRRAGHDGGARPSRSSRSCMSADDQVASIA